MIGFLLAWHHQSGQRRMSMRALRLLTSCAAPFCAGMMPGGFGMMAAASAAELAAGPPTSVVKLDNAVTEGELRDDAEFEEARKRPPEDPSQRSE